ncbi:MAG TPA: hypothetical protein VMM15_34305 [Bradyrhizobium sp.]|nr:hypothetical protein [Bradyrhizobium sp.]
MSNPSPLNLREPRAAASSAQLGRKILIVALAALITSTMIAWCGLIGWGAIELLRVVATAIHRLWTGLL